MNKIKPRASIRKSDGEIFEPHPEKPNLVQRSYYEKFGEG